MAANPQGDPRAWLTGPRSPERPLRGEVHLWSADLDRPEACFAGGIIDARELAHAADLVNPLHADRYRVAHWMRRSVLSRYCGIPPSAISYALGPHGRPGLAGTDVLPDIRFNASESGGLAVLAVTSGADVGVDVEMPGETAEAAAYVPRSLHPLEVAAIARLSSEREQRAAFYRCWTRKEALVKGLGLRLADTIDRFAVSVEETDAPTVLAFDPDHGAVRSWCLSDLSEPPDIYCAVALAAMITDVRAWSWAP